MTVTIEPRDCAQCKKKTMHCVSTGKKDNKPWTVVVCEDCRIASGKGLSSQLLIRLGED